MECECNCDGDCSFEKVVQSVDFVALIKVVEYSDYLKEGSPGEDGNMPLSMTVEILKKYKGSENRKQFKIWGDDGALCRPYISQFKVGGYYLIAPEKIIKIDENNNLADYELYACWTDYLAVDDNLEIVKGKYSATKNNITLKHFEKEFDL